MPSAGSPSCPHVVPIRTFRQNTLAGRIPIAPRHSCSAPHATPAAHAWWGSSQKSEAVSHAPGASRQSRWQSLPRSPRRCPHRSCRTQDHSTTTPARRHRPAPPAPPAPPVPTVPTARTVPTVPIVPTVPTVSTVPTVPTVPIVPTVPTAPTAPTVPTVPTAPTVPTVPTIPNQCPVRAPKTAGACLTQLRVGTAAICADHLWECRIGVKDGFCASCLAPVEGVETWILSSGHRTCATCAEAESRTLSTPLKDPVSSCLSCSRALHRPYKFGLDGQTRWGTCSPLLPSGDVLFERSLGTGVARHLSLALAG